MVPKLLLGLLTVGLLFSLLDGPPRVHACAGYTITVGSDGSPQQELVTQIMAELIRQRTGTKIKMVRFASQAELQAAAEQHDVDLLLVTKTRPAGTGGGLPSDNPLRLLKPFGYQAGQVVPAFHVATLKRFPALQRLINRLAGEIDDATLMRLQGQVSAETDLRAVAKKFLHEQQLIFGS